MATYKLKVMRDTYFKQDVLDSTKLEDKDKVVVKADTEFTIAAYMDLDNHWRVTIKPPGSLNGFNTHYCFKGHVELDQGEELVETPKGANFNVPGYVSPLYFAAPIYPGSKFTWEEALHYNPATGYYRKPTEEITDNIIKIARSMNDIRKFLGGYPITVSSWYRDPASNRRAGGSSKSYHMKGLAVDWFHSRYNAEEVRKKIRQKWIGGIEESVSWVHTDLGPDRNFYP